MNSDFLKVRLMEILQHHRGRDRAIPRLQLLFELQSFAPELDEKRFKEIYTALPVCACPKGMFLPKTAEDVQEFKAYLTYERGPVVAAERVKVVYSYYPHLAPSTMKQEGLFE